MKNRLYWFLIFLFSIEIFGQTNIDIKKTDGTILSSPTLYCSPSTYNLMVDNMASTGMTGIDRVSYVTYKTLLESVTGEIEVQFPSTGTNQARVVNEFSKSIDLGFDFNFFGKTYSSVSVGSNGRIVLGSKSDLSKLADKANFIDRSHSNNGTQLASSVYNQVYATGSAEMPLGQVFAGFANLTADASTAYKYKTFTEGSISGIVFSFKDVIAGNGSGSTYGRFTSQVVIYSDGRILIYIKNKNYITYNSLLGLQDESATKILVPDHPKKNTSNFDFNNRYWDYDSAYAYLFSTATNRAPTYTWTVDKNNDGTDDSTASFTTNTFNYNPATDNEKVSVKVTFAENSDVYAGSVVFKKVVAPTITSTVGTACGQATTLAVNNPVSGITYTWYSDDPAFQQTGTSISAAKSGSYYAVPNGCVAQKSDPVNVVISSQLTPLSLTDGKVFTDCDSQAQASKSYNLSALTGYLPGTDYTIEFTGAAGNIIANAANNYMATVNSGETRNFKIVVTSLKDSTCRITTGNNFSVNYQSFPVDANLVSRKLCLGTASYSVNDFKTDFPAYSNFDISFSKDGSSFTENMVNPTAYNSVFVKLTKSGFACDTDFKLKFQFNTAVTAKTPTTQLPPRCGNKTETFNLASLIPEITNSPNVTVSFHESLADAQNGLNPVALNYKSAMGSTTLYIRVVDNTTGCVAQNFPTTTLVVYAKPTLLKTNIALTNCPGNSIFNLTQTVSALTDAQAPVTPVLEYYDGNGQLIAGTDITAYNASTHGLNPTIKVIYNPTCSDDVTFSLGYYPKSAAATSQTIYCEETSYTLDQFKNLVIANPAQYTFYEADQTTALRSVFDLTTPLTLNYYIKNNTTGCWSELQTFSFVKGTPTAITTTESNFTTCDATADLFDGKTVFDLTARRADFTTDANAIIKYFKDAAHTQEITSPSAYTNETEFSQKVYLKIQSTGYCPSYASLILNVNIPTRSTTLQSKYYVCYNNAVTVDAGSENITFNWSDGQTGQTATFTKAGNYSVVLTNTNGCSYRHNFTVSDENQPKISSVYQTNDRIEVFVSGGTSPYTYYFNGISNGKSNVLLNPTERQYEIYAISADGCQGPSTFVYTIVVNNVITPNGDGYNDTWNIPNLDKMQNVEMLISDRYGKTVFHTTDGSKAWDGTVAGRVLPTATYWYVVRWFDSATQKNEVRQGWILLKNRN